MQNPCSLQYIGKSHSSLLENPSDINFLGCQSSELKVTLTLATHHMVMASLLHFFILIFSYILFAASTLYQKRDKKNNVEWKCKEIWIRNTILILTEYKNKRFHLRLKTKKVFNAKDKLGPFHEKYCVLCTIGTKVALQSVGKKRQFSLFILAT